MSRVVSGDGCHLVTLCWDDEDAPGCSGGGGRGAAASTDAPRDLSEPADMFADMARRAEARLPAELEKLRQEAAQRRVPSVGTVCTGVDTPVLALDMLSEALGVEVAQHVFSCETEPRQRAFAVRGTTRHPGSLLFKHVEDLGLRRGRTAFGNTVCVPDVDVLVVNTGAEGFDLEDETTRGWRVFNSALRYAARHAPSVVVVDNVAHAAWEDVARRFTTLAAAGGFGYKVTAVATSASSFYLPQKRDRLYFVASRVERRRGASSSSSVASNAAARRRFCHALFVLSRAATRNLESFLLPDASPAVQAGLRDPPRLRPNGGVDLRADSGKDRVLGRQRPYTRWSEEGRVDPPRGTAEAAAWLQRQPDLVKDTIDAAFLERAYAGADDRYCSTAYNAGGCRAGDALAMRTGRSACVAPGWLPFVPSRGRPLCGQECLALQGVPTRSFDLRGCPEPLLREVAGNAMPTTVIGAVALSALLTLCDTRGVPRARSAASTHALPSPMQSPMRSPQPLTPTHEPATPAAPASDASPSFAADSSFGAAVEEADEEEPLDLSAAPPPREGGVLAGSAAPAVPACACGAAAASRCAGCLLERCAACLLRGSNPRHEFAPLSEAEAGRVPQPTRKELLASLPTCVAFEMDVPVAAAAAGDGVGEEDAEAAARRAHHARIRGLLQSRPVVLEDVSLRGAEWTAVYGCKAGDVCVRLVFSVGGHAEWRVFLPAVLPSGGRHEHHGSPTVVVDCRTGALRVAEPSPAVVALEICGTDGGDSWEAGLGLNVDGLRRAAAQHPTTLTVRPAALTRVGPAAAAARALDVSGTYRRLEGCGGVRGVLYKRVGEGGGVAEAAAPRDMFFFLDPSCAGVEAEDAFCVFAPALGGGRCSQRVAAEHGFFPRVRPEQAFHVRCTRLEYAPAVGRVVADADVGVVWHSSGSSSNSDAATLLDITSDACRRPVVLARCSLPVCGAAPADAAFEHLPVAERGWHEFGTHQATAPVAQCSRCVPTAPLGVDFSSVGSVAELAFAVEASVPTAYIEALGHRPRGLHVVQRLGAGGGAELSLVANPAALAHRLLSGRPTARRCTWSFGRVDESVRVAAAAKGLRSALNRGCEKEAPAVQPAGFSGTLREDQLRVLAWMLKRETAGTWYDTFGEEETLGDLVLRVVVQETVTRMGGVLAHEPGYGKTALVLALAAGDDGDGGLATLVVAPTRTLAQQWGAEARACTSGRPVVVALGTSEATAATAEAAAAAQANGAGGFVVVDHAALASSAWALRVQWRRLVVDEHEQSGMAASVRERLISVAERAGSTWLLSSAANLTSLPAVLRAAALLRVRVGDETWTTDPQSFRAGSCAASFVWRYVRRSVCAAPATAAASAASVATTAVLGSVDSVTTRQQRRVCRRLRHTSGQGDGDVALQVRAAAGLLPDGEPLEDEEAKLDAQLAALLDSLEGDATKAYQRRAEARREFSDRAFECRLNLWPSVARSSDADVRAAVDAVIRSATTLAATASPPRKRSRRGTPEQVEEQLGKMGAELSRTAAVVTDTVRALRYLRHSRADGCGVCEEDAGGEGTGLMVSVACGHVAHARHFEQRMRTPASLCPVAGCAAVVNPSLLHVVEDNADDESHGDNGSGDGNSVTRSKLEDACSLVERLCATASVPGGSSPRVVVYGQDVVVLQAFEERLNERNLTVASSLQRVTTRVGGNFLARAKNTDVLLARLGDLDGVRLAPFVAVVFLHPVFAEPGAPAGSAAAMEQRAIAQVHAEEGVALQVFRCVAKGTIDDELMASLLAEASR